MDVIIIGAGISGIAAGRHLANQGGFNVTLLEARPDRYGGRMWTNKQAFPNAVGCETEMGAAWIHDVSDENPIAAIRKKLNLKIFPTHFDNQVVYSYATGEEYSEEAMMASLMKQSEVATTIFDAGSKYEHDVSYEEAIEKEGLSSWASSPFNQYLLTTMVEAVDNAPLSRISAKRYNPEIFNAENISRNSLIVEGYSQILDSLVNGIEKSEKQLNIQLNKEVTHIEVKSDEKKVFVRTKAGEQLSCDAVVVTVPLGVLKADVISFSPPLPEDFQQAVRQVGFGIVNKLVLEFDEIFWPKDVFVIGIAGDDDTSKRGLMWNWFNMNPVVKKPVLVGLIQGDGAIISETLTKQELVDIALRKLKKVFGESVVNQRRLLRSVRSQWGSDPYARGSYSFSAVGTTIEMHQKLGSSVSPFIHFAGEHTLPEEMGTVHGAYISGVRAAKRITGEK